MEATNQKPKLFRILSLNGGGARRIYQAKFLKDLSVHLPSPLRSNFDLISGTSTGAILAAAVACDIDLDRVEQFYKTKARRLGDIL